MFKTDLLICSTGSQLLFSCTRDFSVAFAQTLWNWGETSFPKKILVEWPTGCYWTENSVPFPKPLSENSGQSRFHSVGNTCYHSSSVVPEGWMNQSHYIQKTVTQVTLLLLSRMSSQKTNICVCKTKSHQSVPWHWVSQVYSWCSSTTTGSSSSSLRLGEVRGTDNSHVGGIIVLPICFIRWGSAENVWSQPIVSKWQDKHGTAI